MTALAELSYSLLHGFTTISPLLSGEGHLSCFLVTVCGEDKATIRIHKEVAGTYVVLQSGGTVLYPYSTVSNFLCVLANT